jgi:hypothetical protein
MRTRVYAVRETATKRRVSYRYRKPADAVAVMRASVSRGAVGLEVYATSQDLPRKR